MRTKLLILPAGLLLVAAGAAATAQADLGGPAPSDAPPSTIEVPTALEDWCGFVAVAIGPGAAAPSVSAALDESLATGEPTPELAYVVQLGGAPAALEGEVAVLLAALESLVAGTPVVDPAAAGVAADSVDAFAGTACGA
jgi:hypothetical protein